MLNFEPPLSEKPPTFLYKYEALSTQSLLNLKSQIIYFGSPLNFNDPYDCALTPNIEIPADSEIETIRQHYLKQDQLPGKSRQELETLGAAMLGEGFRKATQDALDIAIQEFLTTKGVACFSERNDNLLMWSHYGGHYKGFCLQFATSSEAFQKISKVRYSPVLPRINVAEILLDPKFQLVQKLFCTKSEAWAYEEEWRAIHHVAGTKFGYPPDTLAGIYFGPDIDRQSLEIVCLILAGQNPHVKLWRGHRSTTEFRVLFENFTYSSHLDAVRSGLVEPIRPPTA
jgi:Protein of unknown function (DUF2971)